MSITEILGFATGALCVWLVVRENVWNWPIGIANNIFFFVLFLQSRLYGDMTLQVVYLVLGIYGWRQWLVGGEKRTELRITRTTRMEWIVLCLCIPVATWSLRHVLFAMGGAAPYWDALTTVLSLAAQYLLCQKRLENWLFWMVADIIYVPLYVTRQLPLTALLYAAFLVLCIHGWRRWNQTFHRAVILTSPEGFAT